MRWPVKIFFPGETPQNHRFSRQTHLTVCTKCYMKWAKQFKNIPFAPESSVYYYYIETNADRPRDNAEPADQAGPSDSNASIEPHNIGFHIEGDLPHDIPNPEFQSSPMRDPTASFYMENDEFWDNDQFGNFEGFYIVGHRAYEHDISDEESDSDPTDSDSPRDSPVNQDGPLETRVPFLWLTKSKEKRIVVINLTSDTHICIACERDRPNNKTDLSLFNLHAPKFAGYLAR